MNQTLIDPAVLQAAQQDLQTWQDELKKNPKQIFKINDPSHQHHNSVFNTHLHYLFFNIWDLTYGKSAQNQMQTYVNQRWFNQLGPNFKQNLNQTIAVVEALHENELYLDESIPYYPIDQLNEPIAITHRWILNELSTIFGYLKRVETIIQSNQDLDDYINDYLVMLQNLYTKKPDETFVIPEFEDPNLTTASLTNTTSIGALGASPLIVKNEIDQKIHNTTKNDYNKDIFDGRGYSPDSIKTLKQLLKKRDQLVKNEYITAFNGIDGLSKYLYQDQQPITIQQVYDHFLKLKPNKAN